MTVLGQVPVVLDGFCWLRRGNLVSKFCVFFCSDIDFPTPSALTYHVCAHLLYFLSRWVNTFPLVECPLGTRHWVKCNIFILILPSRNSLKTTSLPSPF